jgi:hypothetical protein
MSSPTHHSRRRRGHPARFRCRAAALVAASIALLAAMPTASALASPVRDGSMTAARAVQPQTAPGELLGAGQLEGLLAALPLSDLNAAQLAHYLAGLEGVSALASLHIGLLGTEELGAVGLEEGLRKGIEELGPAATIGALTNASALLPDVEAKLDGLLASLLGPDLDPGQRQGLSEALQTLDLDRLVGSLLGSATEPTQLSGLSDLAGGLFEHLGSGAVEGLIGSTLTGHFAPTTVEGAAKELGSSSEAVQGELGQTAAELPATATMLTAPVTGGKLLAVAPAVKGLAVGLLGAVTGEGASNGSGTGSGEGGSGAGNGNGGSGAGSGNGGGSPEGAGEDPGAGKDGSGSGQGGGGTPGAGGAGGQGAGGGAIGITLVVNPPSANAALSTAASAKSAKARKIEILRARTKGAVATIVLQAPAAGRLALRGRGLSSSTRKVPKAQRVTLTVKLSKAGAASLRRRHGPLRVRLEASFRTAAGASSATAVTLSFR